MECVSTRLKKRSGVKIGSKIIVVRGGGEGSGRLGMRDSQNMAVVGDVGQEV